MTEPLRVVPLAAHRPPPKRASRGLLKAWAWVAGSLSFLLPTAILAAAPKPAASAVPTEVPRRAPVVIIHHVIRRVVVPSAPRVVTVGSPTVVTGGGSAAPAASTGGSHP
jgi:hypothetical protein